MSEPSFAVVGHPNKGKSSIVATLAHDDSVAIAAESGTTVRCRRYPMRVDDRVVYTLVDTPGFQRPRRALAWMEAHATSAAERAQAVAAFVDAQQAEGGFPDECELLGPLLAGAGILYVVDGSRPFGREYEAEMEILRWTGCPSMALINTIGDEDHVEEWSAALGQYFKVVRRFDAMTADFDKRLELLRAFGQLREEWRRPLQEAVSYLESDRADRCARAAGTIASMISDILGLSVTRDLKRRTDVESNRPTLIEAYKDKLRRREKKCRDVVERIYEHHKIERQDETVDLLEHDLFALESWYLWGLSRGQMLTAGAAGGAVAGGMLDASLGGSSFLLGTIIGAAAGGVTTFLTADRLAQFKVMHQPLGGTRLRFGPTRNINFPHVLLGRARYHHRLVAGRTHAQRGALTVAAKSGGDAVMAPLPEAERKRLKRLFGRLRKGTDADEVHDELTRIIEAALVEDAKPAGDR